VRPELVAALSSDLDALASSLQRAGAEGNATARLLEAASAAVVDALALSGLRDAPNRLAEAGRVYTLDRQIEADPAEAVRVVLA
jgi:hypothetical protein